jgi:raffinose/stachyose/melibiose transport system permease protein
MKNNSLKGYLFIAPMLIFFAIFLLYPIINSIILSFFEWKGFTNTPFENFIGFSNYIRMSDDSILKIAFKNTFYFVSVSLLLQNLIGLAISFFLFYGKLKGSIIWRSIIFFPAMLSAVIIGLVWRRIFMEDGLLNQILYFLKLDFLAIPWLTNFVTPIWVVTFVSVWQWTGYNMVIYYAALQGLDYNIIESAKVDGANWMGNITKIVIPQLWKTISLVVILNIIGGFKVFDLIYVMTKGGPAHKSEVLTSHIYFQSFAIFGTNRMGYASAIAVILTLIVLIFSIVRIYVDKKTF